MPNLCSPNYCTGCSACAQACPKQCITMTADREGFLYPQIDASRCVECGRCESVCPILQSPTAEKPQPSALAAHSTDSDTLAVSSSGGVFTQLAQRVIAEGGVVFGAAFDGVLTVRHIAVETVEGLSALRGSKYLQSVIGDSYRQAKQALDAGRRVLFSGTPCQVGGLRAFLGKNYDHLLCVDIICHSVPSPKVWRSFVNEVEANTTHKVISANFRGKRDGWQDYYLCLQLDDGSEKLYRVRENPYMQAFLSDLSTRPSCYDCHFKGTNRAGDLTLGDFWGVKNVCPDAFFEKGTSLILANNEKGRAALDSLGDRIVTQAVDYTAAIAPNPAYSRAATPHAQRAVFFERLEREAFSKTVNRLLAPTLKQKFKRSLPYRALAKLKRLLIH